MNHSWILQAALVGLNATEYEKTNRDGTKEMAVNTTATVSAVLPSARKPQQFDISIDEVDPAIIEKAQNGEFMYKLCKISTHSPAARIGAYAGAKPTLSISGTLLEIDGKPLDALIKSASQQPSAKA